MSSKPSIPSSGRLAVASLLAMIACGPKGGPTEAPESGAAVAPEPEAKPAAKPEPEAKEPEAKEPEAKEPEAKGPAAKVPEGSFAIGTFNVEWAYDAISEKRPSKAKPNVAKTDEMWEWKRNRIVELIVAERLDIVVLTELGGERELTDITTEILVKNGYDYRYAWVESADKFTGQQVAILSRFPIDGERRDEDTNVSKHLAAEVELPNGQMISVVAVHFKEGRFKAALESRQREARAVQRFVRKLRRKHPVIVAGTFGSTSLPGDDDYKESAPGTLTTKGCTDSASQKGARETSVDGKPVDRIIVCGMELESAQTSGRDQIVRGDVDPDEPWPEIPADEGAKRDVSDHLVLWASVAIPKEKVEGSDEGDDEGDDEE